MAINTTSTSQKQAISLLIVYYCCLSLPCLCNLVLAQEEVASNVVPAMFVFGDSLVDSGNNNFLPSLAKANYFPYGIDFASGPTGRFSNGYTMVDEIAALLGLPLVPPSSQASAQDVLHGANFASAAAGILDVTGQHFVARIPFNQQIQNFESTLNQLAGNAGAEAMPAETLARCILFIGMGSNDYLNNYIRSDYNSRNQYNPDQFSDLLVQQYTSQLTRLYNLGGRKFVIAGVGSLGCIPSILAQYYLNNCSPEVDSLIVTFNDKVKSMIGNLNENLPGARFIYFDNYRAFADILRSPSSYGFTVTNRGCCGIGRNSGQITCLPLEPPCLNREQYIFWDAFHPTAAVNIILARQAFSGSTDVVFPMNILQLADL